MGITNAGRLTKQAACKAGRLTKQAGTKQACRLDK